MNNSGYISAEEIRVVLSKMHRFYSRDEIEDLIDAASFARENRRHKSPRALERASFTFEITADFGCYRDLQRHRILTQDRQLLTTDLGYYIPDEILNTSMEKKYRDAKDIREFVVDSRDRKFEFTS